MKDIIYPRRGKDGPEGELHSFITSAPYPLERVPLPMVQVAVWTLGPLCMGAENFATTGTRTRNRGRESLY